MQKSRLSAIYGYGEKGDAKDASASWTFQFGWRVIDVGIE